MAERKKFISQYTRSFFLSKATLKVARTLAILYELVALLIDYIQNWNGGIVFPQDFTSLVILVYFSVVLAASYKFTKSKSHELSTADSRIALTASVLFAIAFTSALFDTVVFWSVIYPKGEHKITFFTLHLYIFNLIIMLAECSWSLMTIPAFRFVVAAFASGVYVGIYFLWRHLNHGWMVNIPHGSIPIWTIMVVGILVVYLGSFWVVFGVVALRELYHSGTFTREEKYHILESQTIR